MRTAFLLILLAVILVSGCSLKPASGLNDTPTGNVSVFANTTTKYDPSYIAKCATRLNVTIYFADSDEFITFKDVCPVLSR